jgi:hypothetical protein
MTLLAPRCTVVHLIRCSEQAIPVIVLLNKMDRTDALPFAELEVRARAPRHRTGVTTLNRKRSTTRPLRTVQAATGMLPERKMHGTCAVFRPAWRTPRAIRCCSHIALRLTFVSEL